jgi:uncharacterized membrane protein
MEPPPVREVPPETALHWLRLGWQDLRRAGFPSLLHGLIVTVFSVAIIGMTLLRWELVMIAASCFLITGPFLATGLYAISKELGEGKQPRLKDAIDAWGHASKCLFRFGLLLVLVCCLWVALSLTLFYLFVDVRIADPMDFLRYVLTQHDRLFVLWSILGGMVAAVVFGITVVSVPLLTDRDVNTWLAVRTSVRAVGENPVTMLWWSMVILFATGLSFVTLMLGFIVLYPVMGHASWHVYRDVVEPEGLPLHPRRE